MPQTPVHIMQSGQQSHLELQLLQTLGATRSRSLEAEHLRRVRVCLLYLATVVRYAREVHPQLPLYLPRFRTLGSCTEVAVIFRAQASSLTAEKNEQRRLDRSPCMQGRSR